MMIWPRKQKKVFKKFKRDDEKEKLSANTVEKPAKKGDSSYKELKSEPQDIKSKYEKMLKSQQANQSSSIFDYSEEANMIRSKGNDISNVHQICSDAGASTTMTPDLWRVSNFKELKKVVNVANGQSIHAIGIGSINNLDNVLVVPDLKDTLVSVSQLDKLGYFTVYGKGEVNIYDAAPDSTGANIIGIGKLRQNGLYYFNNLEFLEHLEVEVEVDEDQTLNNNTKPINKRKFDGGQEIPKPGHYTDSTSRN